MGEADLRLGVGGVAYGGNARGGNAGAVVFQIHVAGGDGAAFGDLDFGFVFRGDGNRGDGEFENAGGVAGFGGFEFLGAGGGFEGDFHFVR